MKTLLQYFEELCAIPHVSGHEAAIADHVVAFAKEHGLEHTRDGMNNVVIVGPASPGYEKADTVMLQGHLDMVGAARVGLEHDFLTQPLQLEREGDVLRAKGTTLGGDNGVAIAYMLWLLGNPDLRRPRLECVMTVQEETGLLGATGLCTDGLKARKMINLDAGPEGTFLVSCAGGCRLRLSKAVDTEPVRGKVYRLSIAGLKSGHSGADIHLERANSLVLAGLVMDKLRDRGARLVSLSGGVKDNVIPGSATVVFAVEDDPAQTVSELTARIKETYAVSDPDICMELCADKASVMLQKADSDAAVDLLTLLPHGVDSMSAAMPGLVETSSNLAVAEIGAKGLEIALSLRSSAELRKGMLRRRVERLARLAGAAVEASGDYPGWAYDENSPLREQGVEVYRELFGKEPVVEGIHAGLECGVFKGKMPCLDIIAIGPDTNAIHTPEEWLSVSSFERGGEFLIRLLETLGD